MTPKIVRNLPKRQVVVKGVLLTLVGLLAVGGVARAESKKYGELLKRIPEQANVMMFVDAESLLNSPLAEAEKWRQMLADRPTGVLGVGLDAKKLAIATRLDPRTLDEEWKIGMVESAGALPKPSTLANREGGRIEEIETQKVVWTPRNFYLFTFEPNIIGFVVPSDRQRVVQWIVTTLSKPRTFAPAWADRALFRADQGSQVVLAVNLKDVLSKEEIESWLMTLPGVKENKLDASILAARLATVKSAFLQVDVTRGIKGTVQIEFNEDLTYAAPVAKEIVTSTLAALGAQLGDDMASWAATVQTKTISLEGRLDTNALRRILSIASAPRLTTEYESTAQGSAPAADPNAPAAPRPEPSEPDVAKASQLYFRSIVDITDAIRQQRNQDWTHIRFWMDKCARQIDELPILYVDTDLLDWGALVSKELREMAFGINYVNKDRQYRRASSPKGFYGGYGYGVGYASGPDVREMKTQSNSMISVGIDGTWKGIESSIGEMRRKMVEKYKVDF